MLIYNYDIFAEISRFARNDRRLQADRGGREGGYICVK